MSTYYIKCPDCGANLDPGEKCDCHEGLSFIGIDLSRGQDFSITYEIIMEEPEDGKTEG